MINEAKNKQTYIIGKHTQRFIKVRKCYPCVCVMNEIIIKYPSSNVLVIEGGEM